MVNKTLLLAAAAALIEQAMAFNSHRHGQLHAEKRDPEIDVVTFYETVVVTAGAEVPAATEAAPPVEDVPAVSPTAAVVVSPTQQTTLATAVRSTAEAAAPSADVDAVENTDSVASGLGFNKRGMVYASASLANAFGQSCTKCGWAYNWDSSSGGLSSKFSFVPMLWSNRSDHTQYWFTNVDSAISSGSKAILSFNEPDMAAQADMTPAYAAAAHAKWLNKYSGKVLIGAPAVTNSGSSGQGLDWLKQFFTACNAQSGGCKVDFCPIHWYSGAEYGDTLLTQLSAAHTVCGNRPIWLTEFAPTGASDQQKSDFMTKYLPQLDSLSYLDAYSYFMVADGNLMSGTQNPSSYGHTYATV